MDKKWLVSILGAAAVALSGGAFAQVSVPEVPPFYLGAEIGLLVIDRLEAEVTVPSTADPAFLAELFITSTVHHGDSLAVAKTDHHKCGRCWRLLPEVESDGSLCARCTEVVE